MVDEMLGHKNYRTTQRYAHIADYVLRNAANLTSKVIMRAGRSGACAAEDPEAPPLLLGRAAEGGLDRVARGSRNGWPAVPPTR